jgi:hypothetical protein
MSQFVNSFAGQNWLITPVAAAPNGSRLAVRDAQGATKSLVNEEKLSFGPASNPSLLLVLTGVCLIDLQGNNVDDWRRETITIYPDVATPLQYAVDHYGISVPAGHPGEYPVLSLDQWAPYAAFSSIFDKDSGAVDAGYAVDVWRPTPFYSTTDVTGSQVGNIFSGIDVDVAVRNDKAWMYRISYHITLLGRIAFLPEMVIFNRIQKAEGPGAAKP